MFYKRKEQILFSITIHLPFLKLYFGWLFLDVPSCETMATIHLENRPIFHSQTQTRFLYRTSNDKSLFNIWISDWVSKLKPSLSAH